MELAKDVHLHVIQSEKFKDIGISVRFLAPLDEKTATIRSLLAVMMCDRCEAYASKKAMSDQQDLLYGTSLYAQTVGYGKAHVIEVRSKMIDPIYVKHDQHLLQKVLCYLKEAITRPLLNEETLKESKQVLRSKLIRMHDNPSHYASSEGLKLGGSGTPLAISSLGELDILEALTLEDVKTQLQQMLTKDRIDVLVCGRCVASNIEQMIRDIFPFSSREGVYETYYVMEKEPCKNIAYEYRKITQSSVFMMWSTHHTIIDENYYALRLGSAIFGQYPSSLLFQEVREKHSLCYSIYANLISFDGALTVSTGVEQADEAKAIALIHKQFQRICEGDFSDALLETTKTMMINSLIATKDSMASLMAVAYQNAILKQEQCVDDRINLIRKVKKEDVVQAFQGCKHQLTFIVSKEDGYEENRS